MPAFSTNPADPKLAEAIRAANVTVHRQESAIYDDVHHELWRPAEQKRLETDLDRVRKLSPPSQNRALDIGCGTGNVSLKLLERGYAVLGLDISSEMLDRLEGKLTQAAKPGPIQLACSDLDSYLADSSELFSVITASSVLHHLPNYLDTLEALGQRTVSGGVLYVTHEPLRLASAKRPVHRLLDAALGKIDSLPQMVWLAVRNVHLPDYTISDFHAEAGLDLHELLDRLRSLGFELIFIRRYRPAKTAVVARIGRALKLPPTTFSIMLQKTS